MLTLIKAFFIIVRVLFRQSYDIEIRLGCALATQETLRKASSCKCKLIEFIHVYYNKHLGEGFVVSFYGALSVTLQHRPGLVLVFQLAMTVNDVISLIFIEIFPLIKGRLTDAVS